jgi:hypothetical protein
VRRIAAFAIASQTEIVWLIEDPWPFVLLNGAELTQFVGDLAFDQGEIVTKLALHPEEALDVEHQFSLGVGIANVLEQSVESLPRLAAKRYIVAIRHRGLLVGQRS